MNKIKVATKGNVYQVIIGNNVSEYLSHELDNRKVFFVLDKNVYKFHKEKLDRIFSSTRGSFAKYFFASTEKNKNFVELNKILKQLIELNFQRDSVIVAIGGGIVGDVAGFAAAVFMRGINFIQIPTTLLAAVDSSVGGKTGINFLNTKNIIGSFHQPSLVLADTTFFRTLPKEEIVCGLGEILKYGFISTANLFDYINNNFQKILSLDYFVIDKIIAESLRIKSGVVKADEKELGLRKILNFGHTFAHAFEVESKHKIKHGQAVILGIACALLMSKNKRLIDKPTFEKSLELLEKTKPYISAPQMGIGNLISTMRRDKKNRNGKIKFVLINSVGEMLIDVEAKDNEIERAINLAMKLFQS
ncbi:MAG: 3-dehydroquinate synthase [Ignavibacteriales bacterium]